MAMKMLIKSKMEIENSMSKELFLEEFSYDSCLKKYGELKNAREALLQDSPSFYAIIKVFGRTFLEIYLKGWLINLNENFNFSKTQNEIQINKTVSYIITDFGYLKLSDWFLFIKRAEVAFYGPYFESIDLSKIHTSLRQYEAERIEVFRRIQSEEQGVSLSIKDRAFFFLKNHHKLPSLVKLNKKFKSE